MPIESFLVMIIGAGPAGLAAAIQLTRSGIQTMVLEKNCVGGLLRNANLVENYPGFPGGITGVALASLMKRQSEEVGVKTTHEDALSLDHNGEQFVLGTDKRIYHSQFVIVATGTQPKLLTNTEIPESIQERFFYEVYPLLRNMAGGQPRSSSPLRAAIIGAGDAAFDYALNLAGRGAAVWILNRDQRISCLPLLWERSQNQPEIHYLSHTRLVKVAEASNGCICLTIQRDSSGFEMEVDAVIAAIGREPQLGFIQLPEMSGKINNLEAQGLLYYIGDVKNGLFRQTSIAVGDGIRAAMQICMKVKENN